MKRLLTSAAAVLVLIAGQALASSSVTVTGTVLDAGPGPQDTITVSDASGSGETGYGFQFGRPFLDGAVPSVQCPAVSGYASQADIKNSYPDGSVEFAVIAVTGITLPANGSATLTIAAGACNNTPLTQAQMLAMLPAGKAAVTFTPVTGSPITVDANTMLAAGNCTPWTQGPEAQTEICQDLSATRAYDFGFDGHTPLHPAFYLTFWGNGNVTANLVVASSNPQQIEDTSYKVAVSDGYTADLSGDQATNPKIHWGLTAWSHRFTAVGSAQNPEVDINYNLPYLASTNFVPNYDPSITVPAATISGDYNAWLGKPHDIYDGIWDGGEYLVSAMGDAGAHPEIGPVPTWDVLWLYTGDWRMRQMALALTDGSAAWPDNLLESVSGKPLSRADPPGSSTGLGLPLSISGRPKLLTYSLSDLTVDAGQPSDAVAVTGPFTVHGPWQFDIAHVPPIWFVPYILTGDPWYVSENDQWQSWIALSSIYPRGPGAGDYGTMSGGQLRALAWDLDWRAEAAFMEPDASPEKAYLTYLTNDALAQWEGAMGVTGTPYDGAAIKTWQIGLTSSGNSANPVQSGDPSYNTQPPLGNVSGLCNATQTGTSRCSGFISAWEGPASSSVKYFIPSTVGNISEGFMEWYWRSAIGRVKQLGFAAEPLQARSAPWLIGMINNSGWPCLLEQYENATETYSPGGFFPTWAAMLATLEPSYLSASGTLSCPYAFASDLGSEGYPLYALSALSFETGEPGGAAAWAWMQANVYAPAVSQGLASNPKWDLAPVPAETLPAQITATPPG